MAEDRYDVVFKGELVRSFELATVKKNISLLFKVQGPKLEALFSGKSIVLKRNLDFEGATQYRVAIKKAGARVDLVPIETPADAARTPPSARSRAVFGERPSALCAPAPEREQPTDRKPSYEIESYGMTLAPVGVDLLAESEKSRNVEVDIDVADLTLKPAGDDLLEASERRVDEVLELDLSALDLAPPGADLLSVDERAESEPISVDTSALSIAEPGARLSAPSPAAPPPPDIGNIRLES